MTTATKLSIAVVIAVVTSLGAQTSRDTFFRSPLPRKELQAKQAVLQTSLGTIVLDLMADAAPDHVAHFITLAREGAYDRTTFHRVIQMALIQGGDPLSKDLTQSARYGQGGFGLLRFDTNGQKHIRGAVSTVVIPGNPDSGGWQFFITLSDQPQLDGKYVIFARVADGLDVAERISKVPTDRDVPKERISILRVTIRDRPAAPTKDQLALGTMFFLTHEDKCGARLVQCLCSTTPQRALSVEESAAMVSSSLASFAHVRTVRGEPLEQVRERWRRRLIEKFNDGIPNSDRGFLPLHAYRELFQSEEWFWIAQQWPDEEQISRAYEAITGDRIYSNWSNYARLVQVKKEEGLQGLLKYLSGYERATAYSPDEVTGGEWVENSHCRVRVFCCDPPARYVQLRKQASDERYQRYLEEQARQAARERDEKERVERERVERERRNSQPPGSSGGGSPTTRHGLAVTFRSCGYRAVGLSVTCTNSSTGKSHTELLLVGDTSPEACVRRLEKACSEVGYGSVGDATSVEIVGSGIVVRVVGPVITTKEF